MANIDDGKISPWATAMARPLARPRFDNARIRAVLREPLLHFAIAGAALFAAGQFHHSLTDSHRIVIDRDEVAQIASSYEQQFGGDPSPQLLETLVQRRIDEEILLREGKALKLDQGDEIVRRRIVQKMQFLQQDLRPVPALSEGDLRRYYAAHAARYGTAERVGFSHVFFSVDKGGDAAARARAQAALAGLGAGVMRAPERGDAFPDSYDFSGLDHEQAQRLFGRTELAWALFSAPVGQWAGPYRSGFGWHLVRVDDHEAGRAKPFDEVRTEVVADAREEARERENTAGFAALKRRYSIVRRDRG